MGRDLLESGQVIAFDEDAFTRADQGRTDDGRFVFLRNDRLALSHSRIIERLAVLAYVGNTVFEQGEDLGHNIDTQTVAGTQILVDPDTERCLSRQFDGAAM